jgi:4-hydroxy-tetrahydrodipicolinate synthase
MTKSVLRGVIAAAATPIGGDQEPDLQRFLRLCRWLLDEGCDGLNVCGTTGEATSFTVRQRMAIMGAAAKELPLARLMAGTGAASVGDAIALTKEAESVGLAGALLLPPFYYKGVSDDGVLRYIDRIAGAAQKIDLYLYNFPALSGVAYTPTLVEKLLAAFGGRIAGLKDSSGDMDYATTIAGLSPKIGVFPGNEGTLLLAREGKFAGCISASVNANASFSAQAFKHGDEDALATAVKIRTLLSQRSLVPSVKAALSHILGDPAFEQVMPPLTVLPESEKTALVSDLAPFLAEQKSKAA